MAEIRDRKSITVSKTLYESLQQKSKENGTTVAGLIGVLTMIDDAIIGDAVLRYRESKRMSKKLATLPPEKLAKLIDSL